jgi:hypothetical protein
MGKLTLTKREHPVLIALDEYTRPDGEFCVPFHVLSGEPRDAAATKEVRRIVRQLARKGLAEYYRGLFTDDGMLCGSGYCITKSGRRSLEASNAQ